MNPIMNSNTQYAFIPEPQESPELPHPIIIIVEGLPQPITTSIVALTLNDAANVCDAMNTRLGLDRAAWTAIAAEALTPPERLQ